MPAAVPLALDVERFRVGEVSYNGIRFPPALHSSARFEPVYDDSGRLMKYLKGSLKIEAIFFPGVLESSTTGIYSGRPTLPYYGATSSLAVESLTAGGHPVTMDTTMEEVRERLSEPCQRLSFSYQGAGNILLNEREGLQDVNNGPKPRVVDWKPLTNKLARVSWECEVSFCPCSENGIVSDIAQFPFTVDININENGATTRTISGLLEIPLTRRSANTTANPTTGEAHAGISYPFDMKKMQDKVIKCFPVMKQFSRTEKFRLSNDRKTLDFTITDTEIQSDEAYGIGCAKENVRLTTSSDLNGGGFRVWGTSLEGGISLLSGYPKSYALAEVLRLFQKYYISSVTKGNEGPLQIKTSYSEGSPSDQTQNKSRGILRHFKFSDEIFGRDVNFSIGWDVFCTPETLFKATGMFKPARDTASEQNQAWGDWAVAMTDVVGSGFQALNFSQNDDIIVSLCTPSQQGPASSGRTPNSLPDPKKDKRVGKFEVPGPNSSADQIQQYSDYKVEFRIESENHTLRHRPLQYIPPYKEEVDRNLKQQTDMKFPQASLSSGSDGSPQVGKPDILHKIRETSYTLVFSGMAVRLEHPVPIPHVKSYGGQELTQIGTDIIMPRKLGNGIDVLTGESYTLHGLIWQKRYALPLPPTGAVIDSDGHSNIYV